MESFTLLGEPKPNGKKRGGLTRRIFRTVFFRFTQAEQKYCPQLTHPGSGCRHSP